MIGEIALTEQQKRTAHDFQDSYIDCNGEKQEYYYRRASDGTGIKQCKTCGFETSEPEIFKWGCPGVGLKEAEPPAQKIYQESYAPKNGHIWAGNLDQDVYLYHCTKCGTNTDCPEKIPFACIGPRPSQASTELLGTALVQIPFSSLACISSIFKEGESKYGRDNWKKGVGDKKYQEERTEHAIRHLYLWANGDRSEDHLAKVGWFVVTQLWLLEQEEKETNDGQLT